MSIVNELLQTSSGKPPTMHQMEESLAGNLCRCTGFRPLLDAAKSFAADIDSLKLLGWAESDILDAVVHGARNMAADIVFNTFKIDNDL